VKNNNSCIDSDTIVLNELGLYIPNAFTPDGDGLNDVFRIQGFTAETEARLQIFDRWGGMVFETSLPGNGWEGNCKSGPCNEGTYVWIIQIISPLKKVFSGTILLIR